MTGLLSGVRVVEAGSLLNVDAVGMLLGDLGADVIKVERPGSGDYLRHILGQITPGNSPAHIQFNRNKRSVTADLTGEAGREVFLRLIAGADVFIDGNIPGMLSGLSLGFDALRARKPDLIYCTCTGFGATGPYSSIPTHGMMMNALAGCTPAAMGDDGLMHVQPGGLGGIEGGGAGPTAAAPHAAFHIAAALVRRSRSGQGCLIDVAATDSVIMGALNSATLDLNQHRLTSRTGVPTQADGEWTGARYQFYKTRDGKPLLFGCIERRFWERFCKGVGREDLLKAPAANEFADYGEDSPTLRRELQSIIGTRDLHDWMNLAAQLRIPLGPAPRGILEARDDEHLRTREIIAEGTHPVAGAFTYVGSPARVDNERFSVRLPAPALGEQTNEILREVGYSDAEIEKLKQLGAV